MEKLSKLPKLYLTSRVHYFICSDILLDFLLIQFRRQNVEFRVVYP